MSERSYRTFYEPSTEAPPPYTPGNAGRETWSPSSDAIREPINIFVDNDLLRDVEVRLETSPDGIVSIHISRRQPPVVALPSAILPSELLGNASRGHLSPSGLVALPHNRNVHTRAARFDAESFIDNLQNRLRDTLQDQMVTGQSSENGEDTDNARETNDPAGLASVPSLTTVSAPSSEQDPTSPSLSPLETPRSHLFRTPDVSPLVSTALPLVELEGVEAFPFTPSAPRLQPGGRICGLDRCVFDRAGCTG